MADEFVDYAVIGAGVSGLAFANWIRERQPDATVAVFEREQEAGGYCRTVKSDGFVWDYSGHFFHFRHRDIEAWLRAKLGEAVIHTVKKRSLIRYRGRDIDFPFQKNIHQLEKHELIECLHDLYFRAPCDNPDSFKEMLYAKLGKAICDKFLIPYNEKLYATDLDRLDANAMGRFFPEASTDDIIRNMRRADNSSYNSTFIYPADGAMTFIRGLTKDLPPGMLRLGQAVDGIDLAARALRCGGRTIAAGQIVSSMPLPQLCTMLDEPAALTGNRVLVFNLGFDKKGPRDVHWIYFPDRSLPFYRVGFYDNILGSDRMSLYVEIGLSADAAVDVEAARASVLAGLQRESIVTDQTLVASHSVLLDPAYAHITSESEALSARLRDEWSGQGLHSIGRYGRWTYCAIEDNIVEARDLAATLAA